VRKGKEGGGGSRGSVKSSPRNFGRAVNFQNERQTRGQTKGKEIKKYIMGGRVHGTISKKDISWGYHSFGKSDSIEPNGGVKNRHKEEKIAVAIVE